jgi:hypothetical protein
MYLNVFNCIFTEYYEHYKNCSFSNWFSAQSKYNEIEFFTDLDVVINNVTFVSTHSFVQEI